MTPAPKSDTRILRLFREYQAVKAEFADLPDDSEEAHEPFYQQMDAIEEKIMALPTTCAADFAAKVIVDTLNGGMVSHWKLGALWREARELVGMPFLGLDPDDMQMARKRLKKFEEWTGIKGPEELLTDERCPTEELLAYCRTNGLSLDWLFLGDEQSLVMMRHYQVKEKACA